jgi:N utilization substance protein A
MKSDFVIALTQLAAERNLPRDIVLSAIEAALVSAYKKDSVAAGQDVSVKLDPGTGDVSVFILKTVVDFVESPQTEITLADARKIRPDAQVGEVVPTDSVPHSAGRIAAQTAKQVVLQRLREAERDLVYEEFADKEGEVISVTVQRVDPRYVTVELGRAEAVLPPTEQIPTERYRVSNKMKVLLQSVTRSTRGPEIIVSRADKLLMKRLFEMEIPEIYSGSVEIMAIAREAGLRSKVAVRATQAGIDPVGSCVGLRGVRIQNIVNELQGEKIDVIEWHKDAGVLIANALSPAQVLRVEIDPENDTATAVVPDRQLSLAIGKEGQNARLAAKLTGWKVDIKSNVEADLMPRPQVAAAPKPPARPVPAADISLPAQVEEALDAAVRQAAPAVEVPEPAEQPEPVAAEADTVAAEADTVAAEADTVAAEAEPVEVAEAEELVEEPVAVSAEQAEAIPVAEQEPAAEVEEPEPVEVEEEEEQPAPVPEPVFELEPLPEPASPVLGRTSSLRDVPDDVWSLRRRRSEPEPGRIRFAEDIVGLRGGPPSRRDRDSGRNNRRTKAGKRRRR